MFVILLIDFVLIYLCLLNTNKDYLATWIKSTMLWCTLLFLYLEVMSIFHYVNIISSLSFWGTICVLTILQLIKTKKFYILKELFKSIAKVLEHNKFLTGVFVLTTILAFLTVPYNWDSMTYHIPRIVHWTQNQSVAHYATNGIRQIANPPFHEFVCLELYILSGNRDIFFNWVQCFSFFSNAWLVFGIAKKLGCTEKFCKLGVLLFCSMPIAFGEAVTTQNDNLATMWLLIFMYYMMDFWHMDRKFEDSRKTIKKIVIMAMCVGLGYLTKPTVSIGMLVLAVVLLIFCIIRRDHVNTIVKMAVLALLIVSIIIMPEMFKNIQTFGAPFPSGTGARQLVGTWNPKYLFINGLKNFSFNLPTIYVTNSHRILNSIIYKIAELMRVDINDPGISEDGRVFSLGEAGDFGHDTAISSTILLVSIFCFFWCLYRRKQTECYQKVYTYVVVALFVVICAFIRWEPFVSRYMLAYLALMCPMAAVWIEDISRNAKYTLLKNSCLAVVSWLGVAGLLMLFSYHGRIVAQQKISRPEGYFQNRSNISDEYIYASETVKHSGAAKIGLIFSGDTYEYPILYMLKHDVERIEHISITNDTGKYEDFTFVPDCILSTKDFGNVIEIRENIYEKIVTGENINVYTKKEKFDSNGER